MNTRRLSAVVLVILGCGGDDGSVRFGGTVEVDGEPAMGAIHLIPTDGKGTVRHATVSDGEYFFGRDAGVTPNTYEFVVEATLRPEAAHSKWASDKAEIVRTKIVQAVGEDGPEQRAFELTTSPSANSTSP